MNKTIKMLLKLEDALLVIILSLMILMATAQIALRNLFDSGIVWGDVLVRIMVLWVGLAGAMNASRSGNHINIDILTRYLPVRGGLLIKSITSFFTTIVCAVVAWFGFQFIIMEFEDGGRAFSAVPVWICALIIPLAFAVISLRYLILAAAQLKTFFSRT